MMLTQAKRVWPEGASEGIAAGARQTAMQTCEAVRMSKRRGPSWTSSTLKARSSRDPQESGSLPA